MFTPEELKAQQKIVAQAQVTAANLKTPLIEAEYTVQKEQSTLNVMLAENRLETLDVKND